MKSRQWMKMVALSGCVIMMVSCHTARKDTTANNAVNEANAAYNQPTQLADADAQTAAAENDTSINEENTADNSATNDQQQQLAKRTYYFDFDSNVIHEDDKSGITANAEYLVSHPDYKIMLEGHTDPRGSREYNIGLGERRAKAVAEMLSAKGVNANQIRIVSYGAEKLATRGHTEADYQLDRRVVLVLLQS